MMDTMTKMSFTGHVERASDLLENILIHVHFNSIPADGGYLHFVTSTNNFSR